MDRIISTREAEVLALLGEHLTHAEIAAKLFLSVRTVESHVASLRRKLDLPAHRDLVRYAVAGQGTTGPVAVAPLTSFVGRATERAALADAVRLSRLVSVVGTGGAGKTRLARTVADDLAEEVHGRTWYVDLVPVSDEAGVSPAVAVACGVADIASRDVEQSLIRGLGAEPALLVLDNCEHVVNAVAVLVERLITACPRLTVLVTSRARLAVPFEHVFPLGGLSEPDALALFIERATSAGWERPGAAQLTRMTAICAALDGLALAIELAAVRLPSLGLDGVERGLSDQATLLTGGSRVSPRHFSMQDTLDWSYRLLEPRERSVLCRVAVFASGFDAHSACAVAGYGAVSAADVPMLLSRLVDQSLLVPIPGEHDRRWRALEPVRQFAMGQMVDADREAFAAHCSWTRAAAHAVAAASTAPGREWHADFDAVVDEMRAAFGWLSGQPDRHDDAADFADELAILLFRAGRAREAQRRYEQAAELSARPIDVARRLTQAADVARCRVLGEEALRLERAAITARREVGDDDQLALALARAAETVLRFEGMFAVKPSVGEADELLVEVAALSTDPAVHTAAHVIGLSRADPTDPRSSREAERAVEVAHRLGDVVRESAAMDVLTGTYLMSLRTADAARCARGRLTVLGDRPIAPDIGLELKDALHMAVLSAVGIGELSAASQYGERHRELGFLREQGDLAVETSLTPDALAGRWGSAVTGGELFLEDWINGGRAPAPGRAIGPCAVAMVHGLLGHDAERSSWLDVVAELRQVPKSELNRTSGFSDVFEAIVLLHRDLPDEAVALLTAERNAGWYERLLHQWRAAVLAEAAVLAASPEASAWCSAAEQTCAEHPIAMLMIARARAFARGNADEVAALAAGFTAHDVPYQAARTLLMAAGPHRGEGERLLDGLMTHATDAV